MAARAHNPTGLAGRLNRGCFRGKIGIMGGSFNPPHAGHLAMAKRAYALAGLKAVIWLVSPQNPLKPSKGMASYDARFAACLDMVKPYPWLQVSSFETCLQNQPGRTNQPVTTAETMIALRRLLPSAQLVWIMGADNLTQFASWDNYDLITNAADILVMGRPGYNYQALASHGRHVLGRRYKTRHLGKKLGNGTWPAGKWAFDMAAYNLMSATALRQSGNGLSD